MYRKKALKSDVEAHVLVPVLWIHESSESLKSDWCEKAVLGIGQDKRAMGLYPQIALQIKWTAQRAD